MLPPLFNIKTILAECEQNELILSANQRLKSKALDAWGQHQLALGNNSWAAPRILTLEQWLEQCWEACQQQAYQPSLMSIATSEQQRVIWEQITSDCGLMQTEELAKQAANAYQNLARWQLSTTDISTYKGQNENGNYGPFIDWSKRFSSMLQRQSLITTEQSYELIIEAFKQSLLERENTIHLLGFDDIAPLFKSVLTNAANKTQVVELNSHQPLTRIRTHASNSETEMIMVSQWAKQLIEEDPNTRIGIIVPELGQCRAEIERALVDTFESHSLVAELPRYTYPFNISAGTPLSESPLINDTLQLLRLCQQNWSVEELIQLLFSPFWGNLSSEREQRCKVADKLLSLGVFKVHLNELRYWSEKLSGGSTQNNSDTVSNNHEDNDELFSIFKYFTQIKQLASNKEFLLPSQWVEYFLQHLDLLHWPGERQPDSHEYQQTQLWYTLLERFCSLDSSLGTIAVSKAIKELQTMANHQPFQAKVTDSPIQVLGILEGAGLHFTHCWIMGLEQQAWPPSPNPNPLLPLQLQREYNMPHASSMRELEFAQSLTKNYFHCADHIVFSSPDFDESNEQALKASSLIETIPNSELNINLNTELQNYRNHLKQSQKFENIVCDKGPTVSPRDFNAQGQLPGGSNVIKAQSANPFDAFALYRLKARNPLAAVNGFSAIEIGNILHEAMADIWTELKNQNALLNIDETQLDTLVTFSVSRHVNKLQHSKRQHLGKTLCDLEIKRQSKLILKWLNDVEKHRPPFKVVGIEEKSQLSLDGVQFSLRLDRIDQLEDGSFLIIDYKTGKSSINDWLGERPKEPQLPIYLFAQNRVEGGEFNAKINGISFAEINVRNQSFIGLGIGENTNNYQIINIDGITPIEKHKRITPNMTWEEAKLHWEKIILKELHSFLAGDCIVDFRDAITANYNQELRSLNRFNDSNRLDKFKRLRLKK